jgi:hypothetical protein
MRNIATLIETQSENGTKYKIKRWDEPGLFKAGDNRFQSIISNAMSVDGAIVIFGQEDDSSEKENLLVQYGLLVGVLDQRHAIICHTENVRVASDLEGIKKIAYSSQNINNAESELVKWLEFLSAQDKNGTSYGTKLGTDEISVLKLIYERKLPHGYTTQPMVEKYLLGKALTPMDVNRILERVEVLGYIRREKINEITTWFVTELGQKYVTTNPKLFSSKALELGLVDGKNGEFGTKS